MICFTYVATVHTIVKYIFIFTFTKKKIVNEMADFNVFCNVLLEMTMIFCNEVSLITAASGLHEQFTEQNTTCHSTTDGDKNLGLPSFSFVIQENKC